MAARPRKAWMVLAVAIAAALGAAALGGGSPRAWARAAAGAALLDAQVHAVHGLEDGHVYQRPAAGGAVVPIGGTIGWRLDGLDAAATREATGTIAGDAWRPLPPPRWPGFAGEVRLEPGWNFVGLRARSGALGRWSGSFRVGLGEVYLVAGQSNAMGACHTMFPASGDVRRGRLGADGRLAWLPGNDPQVEIGGGSAWPLVGTAIARAAGVPVGFVNVAEGGTSVRDWGEGGPLFERLARALAACGPTGVRAVLWHQGESDLGRPGMTAAEYHDRLAAIMAALDRRRGPGARLPWVVALAGSRPGSTKSHVRDAQLRLIAAGRAFRGPDVDVLGPAYREVDGIHLNARGTIAAAGGWVAALAAAGLPAGIRAAR